MARDTCRLPGCENEPNSDAHDAFAKRFCCNKHEVKFDKMRGEAKDAQQASQSSAEVERSDLPEWDGPPY